MAEVPRDEYFPPCLNVLIISASLLPTACCLLPYNIHAVNMFIYITFAYQFLTPVAMAEKTRYSDEELEEFRQIIMAKLDKARRDYDVLKASITHEDNNDTMDTSPTFKVLEEGATTLSKEEAGRLAQRQLKFIQHLQSALVRIENKTYGICRETGQLISKERLRAVPHATLCMEAKLKQK